MKMIIRNNSDYNTFLEAIENSYDKKKEWIGEFKKKPKKRTIVMNNLYWKWIDLICKELGYLSSDKKYISDELKKILGYWEYKNILNKKVIVIKSTAKMSKEEMSKYMNELTIYMSVEYNIKLPNKEDRYFEDFYNAK